MTDKPGQIFEKHEEGFHLDNIQANLKALARQTAVDLSMGSLLRLETP